MKTQKKLEIDSSSSFNLITHVSDLFKWLSSRKIFIIVMDSREFYKIKSEVICFSPKWLTEIICHWVIKILCREISSFWEMQKI